MALADFVRFKAHVVRLPAGPVDVLKHLDACDTWRRDVRCEGGGDPRCLPFHVFTNRTSENTELDKPEQRESFDHVHGPGGRRQDKRGLTWRLEPAQFHGLERLHVAGRELPRGFHWDVSVDGDPKKIATPTEQWRISRYINVSPDAHLRGRPPFAKRIKICM